MQVAAWEEARLRQLIPLDFPPAAEAMSDLVWRYHLDPMSFLDPAAGTAVCATAKGRGPSQGDLLRFSPVGQITLLNFTDLHAQLVPIYFREPSVNIGVGDAKGLPPHLVGERLLADYRIGRGTYDAYALACTDFDGLARTYGRMGGLDRLATLIGAIRAERPGKVLLLDGGDTWQGSYTSLQSRGADMVGIMNALGVDAMTAHWEFTYGAKRVEELVKQLRFPFLAGNVKEATWGDAVFQPRAIFERGGLRIGVIGQAFPYTPIANPRYMIPDWSFGIEEEKLRARVNDLRDSGVDLVVLLSHNGMDVDLKLASRVSGLDAILGGHTHDGVPVPVVVRFDYNGKVPGAKERAIRHGQRVQQAIETRYADLFQQGLLHALLTVRDQERHTPAEAVGSTITFPSGGGH